MMTREVHKGMKMGQKQYQTGLFPERGRVQQISFRAPAGGPAPEDPAPPHQHKARHHGPVTGARKGASPGCRSHNKGIPETDSDDIWGTTDGNSGTDYKHGATVAHRNGNINGTQSLKIPCHPEVEVENNFETW